MPVPYRCHPLRKVWGSAALLGKHLEIEKQGERPIVTRDITPLDFELDLLPDGLTLARECIESSLACLLGRFRLLRLCHRCTLGGRLRTGETGRLGTREQFAC